jgi:hypothetical protein
MAKERELTPYEKLARDVIAKSTKELAEADLKRFDVITKEVEDLKAKGLVKDLKTIGLKEEEALRLKERVAIAENLAKSIVNSNMIRIQSEPSTTCVA